MSVPKREIRTAGELNTGMKMRPVIGRFLTVVLIAVLVLCSAFLCPRDAFSYTAAQKRAAKAWLSSHGYPPTEDGAWQAYSDWLDGKYWDEFGSPAEYFGYDDDDDDEEDEDKPTAATQKPDPDQENGGTSGANGSRPRSDAETLADVMSGENGSAEETDESETETEAETETETETETESETETTEEETESTAEEEIGAVPSGESVEEPTEATQADIMDMVDATTEKDTDRAKKNLPFAVAGLALVAALLGLVICHDHKK